MPDRSSPDSPAADPAPAGSADAALIDTIRLYRETLAAIGELYVDSGRLVNGSYGWLAGDARLRGDAPATDDAASLAQQMSDLHQGLVMKLYATAVPALAADTMHQRQLGRATLEHIWGTTVMGSRLREAVQWLMDEAESLQWQDLVRPFAQIPALRDRWGQLETLVLRAATLIATADGQQSVADNRLLDQMRQQFNQLAGRASEPPAARDAQPARDAIAWLRAEAERLRSGAAAVVDSSPAAAGSGHGSARGSEQRSEQGSGHDSARESTRAPASASSPLPAPPIDERTPEQRLAEARQKLDELVGLDTIKESIQTLTNFLKLEQLRASEGLPTTRPSLHMSFVGNPGTGKTTVARIVADIYGALGVLAKGHLIETDRSGLVAEYAGQTGPKTNAKVDEALDGVLFIDEAYSLIDESGQDQYGREAVQTLLKRMEDQRDRLVVILAGYTDEMRTMIRSNPGLSSRIGTTMHFDDYSPEQLCRIFELTASKAQYQLTPAARQRLLRGFTYLYAGRDRHFGNGRTSRNSFERTVRRLANRLATLPEVNRQLLTTLEGCDIEIDGLTQSHLEQLSDGAGLVRVTCPHSGQPLVIDDNRLGTEVQSPQGDQWFVPAWGAPVLPLDDEATP